MGHIRFWRRIKIAPGLTLNLSKSGGSLSVGPRGAKHTIGPRGRRTTVGIPGTGLFYTTTSGSGSGGKSKRSRKRQPKSGLTPGFFKRLVTPANEITFIDGCRELSQGNDAGALERLSEVTELADAAFLAGFLHLRNEDAAKAIPLLRQALDTHPALGKHFDKYGLALTLNLPITEETTIHVGPSLRGVFLVLVEAYQMAGKWDQAHEYLQKLRRQNPGDAVILLSLVELFSTANRNDADTHEYIVMLTKNVQNETAIHTAILLYKARALHGLNMYAAAKGILTAALRRKKDRPPDLMLSLRYERAVCYEALGQAKRARADFEKVYAADPGFEDVAERLRTP